MRYINLYEKFSEDLYKERKRDREQELIQELGDEFIENIIAEGDFDGLNFLISTGYEILDCGINANLLYIALNNNQDKMLDFLLKSGFDINDFSLHDIKDSIIDKKIIEILKKITKLGFKFKDNNYNLLELYLSESTYRHGEGVYRNKLKDGLEPFVDWLLKNYPDNYPLFNNIELSDKLRYKYKYLEESGKYNL